MALAEVLYVYSSYISGKPPRNQMIGHSISDKLTDGPQQKVRRTDLDPIHNCCILLHNRRVVLASCCCPSAPLFIKTNSTAALLLRVIFSSLASQPQDRNLFLVRSFRKFFLLRYSADLRHLVFGGITCT